MKVFKLIMVAGVSLMFALASIPARADSAKVTVTPSSGVVNTFVTITGTGFPPNEIVGLYLDAPTTYLGFPGPKSDAGGSFRESDVIPGTTPGRHMICADTSEPSPQQYAAKACAPFTVTGPNSTTTLTDNPPSTNMSGLPLSVAMLAIGVLGGLAIGAALWRRH